MENPTQKITVLCLIIISLILSIASIYLPWWSIQTTRETQIAANTTITVDYTLLQMVAVHDPAMNKSVVVSFADLPADPAERDNVSFLFNTTLILLIGGTVLNALTLICSVISIFHRKLLKIQNIFGLAGALLFVIAPFYIATQAPAAMSNLDNVIPSEISTLPGEAITNFWGTEGDWIWRAGFGWFLAFTACLILAIESAIIRISVKEKY